ncbi:MAG TPA: phosphodiester glycosidase family protein [Anaerolineales bacterium]|nr:phosphodiester glycosidase family protein [Anaerolineales bacterium]
MKHKKPARLLFWTFIVLGLCTSALLLYDRGRPAPIPIKRQLYEGVTYQRVVKFTPRPMIAHVIVIDTKVKDIGLLVTPPDSDGELPLKARTTSQFLEEFGVQIAINGDGFDPWWSNSPADYYPHVGEPVTPLGLTASEGKLYTEGIPREMGTEPTLYISRKNALSFNRRPDRIFQAISGDRMLLQQGKISEDLEAGEPDPRTAIGMNKNGRYLILVVVDGRQPFYSEGATFTQLAQLMIDQGAYIAMSLDGGGSSTLVVEGEDGEPVILNSPIDNYIPGRERPVANHLGVFINQ